MPIIPFVGKDSGGQVWAPDQVHEIEAVQAILGRFWSSLHHLPDIYAVIANMRQPYADLVVITERGIGIIELKGYGGRIVGRPDGAWLYGNKAMQAGEYLNPFRQVQAYAEQLRSKILPWILPTVLKHEPQRQDELKFQTTVCFTNPKADLTALKVEIANWPADARRKWESNFSVRTPEELPAWAAALRFQVDLGRAKRFEPYRIPGDSLYNLVTLRLDVQEWQAVKELMPSGRPYGFMALLTEAGDSQAFSLVKDTITIGRDRSQCEIVVPDSYSRVSRVHARLVRRLSRVFIEDKSTRGTYVEGRLVKDEQALTHGQVISLGGVTDDKRICRFRFTLQASGAPDVPATEASTDD